MHYIFSLLVMFFYSSAIASDLDAAVYKNKNDSGYLFLVKSGDGYEAVGMYASADYPGQHGSWSAHCSSIKDNTTQCQYTHNSGTSSTGSLEINFTADTASIINTKVKSDDGNHEGSSTYQLVLPKPKNQ